MPRPTALTETDRSLFQAVAVVRWLTWAWAAFGLAISTEHLVHGAEAWLLMSLALLVTATLTLLLTRHSDRLKSPQFIAIELATAAVLLIGDGYVYTDARPQSLPWAWPSAGLIACGIALGRRWAVAAAGLLSIASFIGEGLNDGGTPDWGVTASSKAGLYVLTALISGYVAHRLRDAEQQISAARAREEVAVKLHDGVLQTLAVVQRRSSDPELVSLAQDQDRDLRDYLAGANSAQPGLTASLREAASLYERRHGRRAEVIIADDIVEPADDVIAAVAGAVGEALANAGKHSHADRVVVYAEPDDDAESGRGLFISVKDNGAGFDAETVTESIGMRDSIRSRVESIGGRVEIASRPGRGTEVRLWAP
ncbi:MAG: ATP-binding protein [Actinomycetota bacterium]